jgi:hypothetical protein
MKRFLLILILIATLAELTDAQDLWKTRRYEVMGGIGMSQFFGDIGGYSQGENILGFKDFILSQTRFDINAGIKYRIIPSLKVKLGFTYGMLHASDAKGSNEGREFEAKTSFLEPMLTCEYAFIKSKRENSYLFSKGRTAPFSAILESLDVYAFTGIGGLSYSVTGNDKLNAYGIVDGGFTAVIPIGIGVDMLAFPDFNFGIELCGRYSFSDYLDGYTSQYSKSNDVFYTFNVTFTYRIPTASNGLPSFLTKKRF